MAPPGRRLTCPSVAPEAPETATARRVTPCSTRSPSGRASTWTSAAACSGRRSTTHEHARPRTSPAPSGHPDGSAMNLHEYQGRELFARFGIPVLPGQVAATPEEARDIAESLAGTVVIKAQVLVGGRGKAGGVQLARTPDEAYARAREILALTIKGLPVRKVLVARAAEIARELYLAIVLDRAKKLPLIMLSAEGGIEIEQVAKETPEKIVRQTIPIEGLRAYQARALFQPLLKDGKLVAQAADVLLKLWNVYRDGDCSLAEI